MGIVTVQAEQMKFPPSPQQEILILFAFTFVYLSYRMKRLDYTQLNRIQAGNSGARKAIPWANSSGTTKEDNFHHLLERLGHSRNHGRMAYDGWSL